MAPNPTIERTRKGKVRRARSSFSASRGQPLALGFRLREFLFVKPEHQEIGRPSASAVLPDGEDTKKILQRAAALMWEGKQFDEAKAQATAEWAQKSSASSTSKPSPEVPSGKRQSLLPVFLLLGAVLLVLFAGERVETINPGNGRWLIGFVVAVAAFAILLALMIGPSLKQTGKNLGDAAKMVAGGILALVVIGSVGMCATGSGSSNLSTEHQGNGGVPDAYRKP